MSAGAEIAWRDALARLPTPAGTRFSDDFEVWVMFYGTEGGEAASPVA